MFKQLKLQKLLGESVEVLPGKQEQHPRYAYINKVTLRSGRAYQPPIIPIILEKNELEQAVVTEEENGDKGEGNPEEVTKDVMPLLRRMMPKIPFPNAFKHPKEEKEHAKLKELVWKLTVRLPFVETCTMIPSLRKYMKSILTDTLSLEEGIIMIGV